MADWRDHLPRTDPRSPRYTGMRPGAAESAAERLAAPDVPSPAPGPAVPAQAAAARPPRPPKPVTS